MLLFVKKRKCEKDKIKKLNLNRSINKIFEFCFNNLISFRVLTRAPVFVALFQNILDFKSLFRSIIKT